MTTIGARQYDTATGRFISVDPLLNPGDPQQWNGYAYANNNPVMFSDPTGEWCDGCDYSDWTDDSYVSDWNTPKGSPNAPTNHHEENERILLRTGKNKDFSKQPTIPIEKLQVGDMVLSTDPETGETGPRAVLAPLTDEGVKNLVQITIDTDGPAGDQTGTLIATDNHPLLVTRPTRVAASRRTPCW